MVKGEGYTDKLLAESKVHNLMDEALTSVELGGKRVLILIPDGTRSGPVGLFFRLFHELLRDRVSALDYLIALGTHQPMGQEAILRHLAIISDEMAERYAGIQVFNHQWKTPEILLRKGYLGKLRPVPMKGQDPERTTGRNSHDLGSFGQLEALCGPAPRVRGCICFPGAKGSG
jgi:hypothetical protein